MEKFDWSKYYVYPEKTIDVMTALHDIFPETLSTGSKQVAVDYIELVTSLSAMYSRQASATVLATAIVLAENYEVRSED